MRVCVSLGRNEVKAVGSFIEPCAESAFSTVSAIDKDFCLVLAGKPQETCVPSMSRAESAFALGCDAMSSIPFSPDAHTPKIRALSHFP